MEKTNIDKRMSFQSDLLNQTCTTEIKKAKLIFFLYLSQFVGVFGIQENHNTPFRVEVLL